MGRAAFVPSLNWPLSIGIKGLLGTIEVAELERGKLLLEDADHLRNSQPTALPHLLKIEVRIDVEVSHLDEIESRLSDQVDQSLYFLLPVCKSWEYKEVDRCIEIFLLRLA